MSDETPCAVDTSVAVPLLVASHEAHETVRLWATGRILVLSGHALAETYSVLTRLPGDARVSPSDAVTLIDDNFGENPTLAPDEACVVHRYLASHGISGGATYDGLVALAAHQHGLALATRDARARSTYEAVGVQVVVIAGGHQ